VPLCRVAWEKRLSSLILRMLSPLFFSPKWVWPTDPPPLLSFIPGSAHNS
jgi:hypothetical protein